MSSRVSAVPILARRFLLSKNSDSFLSLIAWVSVIGVAVGVLALTVVTSVINGFEGELYRVITGMNGDVVLYTRGDPIRDPQTVEKRIREVLPNVTATTASFTMQLMVSGPSGVAGAVLEGVDLETIGQVTAVPERVVSGRLPNGEGEVAIGKVLAEKVGVQEGSEIRLIVPFMGQGGQGTSSSAESGSPKVMKAHVVGLISMGMYEYDSTFIFAPLGVIQHFFDQPGRVTDFKLKLPPGADTRAASDRLADSFGYPFRAKDWGQLDKNLFYAIRLEKVVISIILTVIVIVAAFNVVSTLMMMINDKAREIAILKAMGFRRRQSFGLFCIIGLGIGIVGTVFGIAGGLFLSWAVKHTHWIELPADIYYIGFLPVVVRWREVGMIAGTALIISFLATLYPAIQISRRSPLDGIRYDS